MKLRAVFLVVDHDFPALNPYWCCLAYRDSSKSEGINNNGFGEWSRASATLGAGRAQIDDSFQFSSF